MSADENVESLERKLLLINENVVIIQAIEPTWALQKLIGLKYRSQRNNLRILGIEENPRDLWGKGGNKIYDHLFGDRLKMSTSNKSIELADRVGDKSNNKEKATVPQFSFYKG